MFRFLLALLCLVSFGVTGAFAHHGGVAFVGPRTGVSFGFRTRVFFPTTTVFHQTFTTYATQPSVVVTPAPTPVLPPPSFRLTVQDPSVSQEIAQLQARLSQLQSQTQTYATTAPAPQLSQTQVTYLQTLTPVQQLTFLRTTYGATHARTLFQAHGGVLTSTGVVVRAPFFRLRVR